MPDEKVEYKKRKPAVERLVCDIAEEDSRVAVIGKITSLDTSSFLATLRDPSGQITLLFPRDEMMGKVEVGVVMRVMGIPIAHEEGFELKAEIIQDFSGFDLDLYNRYMALKKKKYKRTPNNI
jgi:hypothetical protein